MKYSQQHRKAFGEAFDFLNGRDVLRLLVSLGTAEVKAGAAIGRAVHPYRSLAAGSEAVGALIGLVLAAGQVSAGMGLWAIAKMSCILLARMRRPKYYPNERTRRERLARERRRIRERFTTNACPQPAELLEQYAKARTGVHEALRFGSMLCDLEAYCDNSLLRNADGEIVGRNPGVKGWIRGNCPELLAHYKNAMRYKALAEKFRQAAGAADPVPAAALLSEDGAAALRILGGKRNCKITVRNRKSNGACGGRVVSGTFALDVNVLEAALGRAQEILGKCEAKTVNRPRCGIKSSEGTAEKETAKGSGNRLWCGKTTRRACCRVGGVARLETILDQKLCGAPRICWGLSRWRIVGMSAATNATANCKGKVSMA